MVPSPVITIVVLLVCKDVHSSICSHWLHCAVCFIINVELHHTVLHLCWAVSRSPSVGKPLINTLSSHLVSPRLLSTPDFCSRPRVLMLALSRADDRPDSTWSVTRISERNLSLSITAAVTCLSLSDSDVNVDQVTKLGLEKQSQHY